MLFLNSSLNFGILSVLVFQLEVYYKVGRLLIGLTALQRGTTTRWYSNKTSLNHYCTYGRLITICRQAIVTIEVCKKI